MKNQKLIKRLTGDQTKKQKKIKEKYKINKKGKKIKVILINIIQKNIW